MVSWSGWRFFRAACLVVALGAAAHAEEAAVEFESQREQLAVLQPMIGNWKGVGLQKRGGNARWAATTEWAWSFADGQTAIVFTTEPGRYFSRGRLVPGTSPETFRLTLEQVAAKQSVTFVGQWDGSGLDLSNEQAEPGQPARLLVKNVADNKRLVVTVQTRTPSGGYQQIAVLGYTREGATLGITQGGEAQNADEGGDTPLHHVSKGATARMTLDALETNLARFALLCPTATYAGGLLRFGVTPGTRLAQRRIVHRPFAYPDGSMDLVIENASMIGDQSFAHKHSEPMVLTCVFEGCLDETQDSGALVNAGIGA